MKVRICNLALVCFFSVVGNVFAQGKFSGYMFGDYYWVAKNHDSSIEEMNGFWFRRIYFTYDHNLSDEFSVRWRLEMNSDGDFSSSTNIEPFIKDAYIKWKRNRTELLLGISGTPTWGAVEDVWGYRSVEKTPLDLQRWGNSRDFGLAIKGKAGQDGLFSYHVMLANGSGGRSEVNSGKKILAAFGVKPSEAFFIEVYGDWNDNDGHSDFLTGQAFAAYKHENVTIGLQYAHQVRQRTAGDDEHLNLGSVFAVIQASEKVNVFARVDRHFDPNSRAASQSYLPFDGASKNTFLLGGIEYKIFEKFQLMPNVEVVVYDETDAGFKPDSDVIPRMTFFFQF